LSEQNWIHRKWLKKKYYTVKLEEEEELTLSIGE